MGRWIESLLIFCIIVLVLPGVFGRITEPTQDVDMKRETRWRDELR